MPRTRRQDDETKKETTNPPNELPKNHVIACAAQNEGRDIWRVTLPAGEEILVELSVRFRSNCQFRRGSYVLVDRAALADRENKLGGEIVNIVGDDKVWQKMAYWLVVESSGEQR